MGADCIGHTGAILHARSGPSIRFFDSVIRHCQRGRQRLEPVSDHELGLYCHLGATVCVVDQVDQSVFLLFP